MQKRCFEHGRGWPTYYASMNKDFTYDAVAYPSMVFPLVRPGRVAAMAELHGIEMDNVGACRVLELGCGDGMTLLSTAHSMPEAEFLGVDLSLSRISEAQDYADELGLANIRFKQADVLELETDALGEFDFIFAHGFLSWVPESVEEKALELYAACLSPNGVGLISYNTYPGFHLRTILRDAMLYRIRNVTDPEEQTRDALSFARFLTAAAAPDTEYGKVLRHEADSLETKASNLMFHDDLEAINRPFYFHQFAAMLDKAGLAYLGELDPSASSTRGLTDTAKAATEELRNRPLEREQLIDFLRGTRFRSSLICRQDRGVSYTPIPSAVRRLYLASPARLADEQASSTDGSEIDFVLPNGARFSTNHALSKTVLRRLGEAWPEWLSFEELESGLRAEFGSDESFNSELERLTGFLIELIVSEVVQASRVRPNIVTDISERPRVSDFARWQANRGFGFVTNPAGTSIALENDLMRAVLVSMDGTVARSDLARAIGELLSFDADKIDQGRIGLPEMIESFLPAVRDTGLLVG